MAGLDVGEMLHQVAREFGWLHLLEITIKTQLAKLKW
jgi:hypothetical protein